MLAALVLSLSSCADMVFSDFNLDGFKRIHETIAETVRGAASVSGPPERARQQHSPDGTKDRSLCAASLYLKQQSLCAVHAANGDMRWLYKDKSGKTHALNAPDKPGEQVYDFEVDRDWYYVAVITAEEGHPLLAVYNLEAWTKSGEQPDPLYVLNPYPGGLHLDGWENNEFLHGLSYRQNGLRFSTDGPVLKGESMHSNWPLAVSRAFRFDPQTMKISPIESGQQRGR